MDKNHQSCRIILASASPRRRDLLKQIGLSFDILVSDCEEVLTTTVPEEACRSLAEQKAEAVAAALTREAVEKEASERDTSAPCLIIGADTVVACEGRLLGKPRHKEDAAAMLRLLSGRTHQVSTGVCVIRLPEGTRTSFAESTDVTVVPLTEEDIAAYLETGEPYDKAGAYGIQGWFARYVAGIRGDYNNVVGLPVGRLYRECLRDQLSSLPSS